MVQGAERNLGLLTPLILVLLQLATTSDGMRLHKSRDATLALIGAKENRLYFDSCEQSSRRDSCILAIDSTLSLDSSQCAVTEPSDKPWWKGILEVPAYITKVTVLNVNKALMSYVDAMTSMVVKVNDDVCFRYENSESFDKRSFTCDAVGDHVIFQSNRDGSVMSICDVEVLGAPLNFQNILGNAVSLQPYSCEQSSVLGSSVCSYAVDKQTSNNNNQNPCMTTQVELSPFLEVSLVAPAIVSAVKIYNREDCCADALQYFDLAVNGQVCHQYRGGIFKTQMFPCGYFGDRVRVTSGLARSLSICEIEFHGYMSDVIMPKKFEARGCHTDNYNDPEFSELASSTDMHHEKCFKICKRRSKKYFALQNGRHCFCGDSFGKHGASEGACVTPCTSDSLQTCGGAMVNQVFEIL